MKRWMVLMLCLFLLGACSENDKEEPVANAEPDVTQSEEEKEEESTEVTEDAAVEETIEDPEMKVFVSSLYLDIYSDLSERIVAMETIFTPLYNGESVDFLEYMSEGIELNDAIAETRTKLEKAIESKNVTEFEQPEEAEIILDQLSELVELASNFSVASVQATGQNKDAEKTTRMFLDEAHEELTAFHHQSETFLEYVDEYAPEVLE